MSLKEKIALHEEAIKEAEKTLDTPHLPEVVYEQAEKTITLLSRKLIALKDDLKNNVE